jgi:hypothetical protein
MSHDKVDTFDVVINFLSDTWVSMHITMGLFEVNETTKSIDGCTILVFVKEIWFVALGDCLCKYEGNNLTTMATTLHSIIDCEPLKSLRVYEVS